MFKRPAKVLSFNVPIYDRLVYLFFDGETPDEILKGIKSTHLLSGDKVKFIEEDFEDSCLLAQGFLGQVINENNEVAYILWIDKGSSRYVLSHEILHLALNILNDCKVVISIENEEALTYLFEYLYEKIDTLYEQAKNITAH